MVPQLVSEGKINVIDQGSDEFAQATDDSLARLREDLHGTRAAHRLDAVRQLEATEGPVASNTPCGGGGAIPPKHDPGACG